MMAAWLLQWAFAAALEALAALLLRDSALEKAALWVVRLAELLLFLRPVLQQLRAWEGGG